MKLKTFAVSGAFLFLINLAPITGWAATIKMRLVIVNPSPSKTQTKLIKSYLPKEITPKDVVDNGGMEIDYDDEKGMLYATKNVELAPAETKQFEVVIKDVWMVPDDKLKNLHDRTQLVLDKLKDSPYFTQANLIAGTIFGRLDDISRTQDDATVSRQEHIGYYRANLKTLDAIMLDIDRLEKILVTAGGPPNIQLMEKTDVNLKSPTTKTTWILIFIILIFIAILGGAFYFTWQGQARVTENIFTREKDVTFSEFKNPISDKEKKP